MDAAHWIEAVNAGGNVGILLVGLGVLDVRGKMADLRRRLDLIELRQVKTDP